MKPFLEGTGRINLTLFNVAVDIHDDQWNSRKAGFTSQNLSQPCATVAPELNVEQKRFVNRPYP